jgi:hypothetical protein
MADQTVDCAPRAVDGPALPEVVRRILKGDWPTVLRGPEIVDVIILVECGVSAEHFAMWREDEIENATWEPYLDRRWTARLETLTVAEVQEPEGGCAEQAHAVYYSTLDTRAPPIVVEGRKLMDGNHRLEAARLRRETRIDAYVVTCPGDRTLGPHAMDTVSAHPDTPQDSGCAKPSPVT